MNLEGALGIGKTEDNNKSGNGMFTLKDVKMLLPET